MKITIIDAILQINPNAIVNVSGTDIDNCKIEWLENTTPISKEEIKSQLQAIEQEKQDAIHKKASGKQKLLDLGLSEEEVKALIGV